MTMNQFHESELEIDRKYWDLYKNKEPLEFFLSKEFYGEFLELWKEYRSLDRSNGEEEMRNFLERNNLSMNMYGFFTFMQASMPRKDEVKIEDLGSEGIKFKVQKLS